MNTRPIANYQQQDSQLTLQQGLEEYYQRNKGLVQADACESEVAQLFQRHDIVHVIFGCSTSLRDETLADTWTIFGSTVKLHDYLSYLKYSETFEVLGDIKLRGIVWEVAQSIPDMFRVIRRSRRMLKKWNWADYSAYLNQPLRDLRQEFGIQVMARES